MPLFSVSLLFSCQLEAPDPPEMLRELAIHVLAAAGPDEARAKGHDIGNAKQHAYQNGSGETICWTFEGVVEVQDLYDGHLFDGMEVASWLYRGKRLVLNEGWTRDAAQPGTGRAQEAKGDHAPD